MAINPGAMDSSKLMLAFVRKAIENPAAMAELIVAATDASAPSPEEFIISNGVGDSALAGGPGSDVLGVPGAPPPKPAAPDVALQTLADLLGGGGGGGEVVPPPAAAVPGRPVVDVPPATATAEQPGAIGQLILGQEGGGGSPDPVANIASALQFLKAPPLTAGAIPSTPTPPVPRPAQFTPDISRLLELLQGGQGGGQQLTPTFGSSSFGNLVLGR